MTTSARNLRLLCVDDEEDIRVVLQLALALDPTIEAEVTPNGSSMLERAAREHWDAFILDAMMPEMDGYELCRRLKQDPATAGIPVVFLTAKTQRDEMERARSLGAVACLMKPFDPLTIASEVRTLLAAAA